MKKENIQLKIAEDFADVPGLRYRDDGPNSGEAFLEDLLRDKFEEALSKKVKLEVNFDGIYTLPSSFVSASFGKLSLEKGSELLIKNMNFISEENNLRTEKVKFEIKNPKKN